MNATTPRSLHRVTLLSVLDPVRVAEDYGWRRTAGGGGLRVAEDYATVDHLSDGRIELVIGKGKGPEQTELFAFPREEG